MLRRLFAALASVAVVLAGLTFTAGPASAAATNATISVSQWPVGSTSPVTLTWTNATTAVDGLMVRSPWPWGASYPTGGSFPSSPDTDTGITPGTLTVTCPTIGATFTISAGTMTGTMKCSYFNQANNSFKGFWLQADGGTLTVNAGATVTVTIPSGVVSAPLTAQTDTWLVGRWGSSGADANNISHYTNMAQVSTTAVAVDSAGNPLPLITLDIDGNGGTCSVSRVSGYQGTWALAPGGDACQKAGGVFVGFNTSADGSGLSIAPGGNLHLTNDNRLYAIYTQPRTASAPSNVVAVAGRNQVTVSWKAPADPGTGSISNYLVTANPSRKVCITSAASANPLSCTFELPATNTQYTFTAQALNPAGWGELSTASNAVSPFNVILDTATRTQDKVLLVFKGGSTVSVSGRGPGLAPGTVITPQVKIGSGDWVSETRDLPKVAADRSLSWSKKLAKSLNDTPVQVRLTLGDVATDSASLKIGSRFGVPDAPRNVKVTAERGGIRLSWEAPENDGGSPITSYVARANGNGLTPSCRVVAGNPLSCVVLLNTSRVASGTTISLTVTALSARGEGAAAKTSIRGPLRWVDIETVGTGGAPGGKTELRVGIQANGFEVGDAFTVELKVGTDGQWKKQKGQLLISETAGLSGTGDWSGIVPSEALKQGFTVRVANPKAAPDTWTQRPRP